MPTISVKSNVEALIRGAELDRQAIRTAAQRALNTAAKGLKTDAGRELRKRYRGLKLRDVNDLIDIRLASRENLQAVVIARGRPLSLQRFNAGAKTRRGAGGVWVNVKGTRKFIPHAWVQALQSKGGDDYQVIFIRTGKGRYPVQALKTIDIPNAMNIREVRELLDRLVEDRFDKEMARQVTVLSR